MILKALMSDSVFEKFKKLPVIERAFAEHRTERSASRTALLEEKARVETALESLVPAYRTDLASSGRRVEKAEKNYGAPSSRTSG